MTIPRILIIAGSDSGGGAGIQADIKTVTMLGGHAMTAVTAITVQNTLGVSAVHMIPVETVLAQIDAVASDIGVDAVKIGMIASPGTALAVAGRLERMAHVPVVFDPVMVATSGASLADPATVEAFGALLRRCTVATPNLPELAALTGQAVADVDAMERAARALGGRFGCAVLAKGGHLPEGEGDGLTDLLVTAQAVHRWHGERLETRHTHGTGCTMASAVACGLGGGLDLPTAVDRAHAYVAAALRAAPGFGAGSGPIGHALGLVPYHHLKAATDREGWDAAAFDARWAPSGAPVARGRTH